MKLPLKGAPHSAGYVVVDTTELHQLNVLASMMEAALKAAHDHFIMNNKEHTRAAIMVREVLDLAGDGQRS